MYRRHCIRNQDPVWTVAAISAVLSATVTLVTVAAGYL